MKKPKLYLFPCIMLLFFACSPKATEEAGPVGDMSSGNYAADSAVVSEEDISPSNSGFISSSAAVENGKDSSRKFIRTADLKFKVKNVIHSTYDIENIIAKQGGYVTLSNLESNVDYTENKALSADSTLISTYYTISNTMTLRVPNIKLDTTLRQIALNIEFLDYRNIKAENVAIDLLRNRLIQQRIARNEKRLTNAIDNRGKKLNETANAEELLYQKQETADNSIISTLTIKDQIEYSTINLIVYQNKTVKHELIANDKSIEEYEPGFGTKLVDSIKTGWIVIEVIFLFMIKLWGVILFALLVFALYRYFKKLKK